MSKSKNQPAPIQAVLPEVLVVEEIAARGRPLSIAELVVFLASRCDLESVCLAVGRLLDRGEIVSQTGTVPFGHYPVYRFSLPPGLGELGASAPCLHPPPSPAVGRGSPDPDQPPAESLPDSRLPTPDSLASVPIPVPVPRLREKGLFDE